MIEKIIWHRWPDKKPKLGAYIMAQNKTGHFKHTFYARTLRHGEPHGDPIIFWCEYNPDKHCYEDKQDDIVAWANEPMGLAERNMSHELNKSK